MDIDVIFQNEVVKTYIGKADITKEVRFKLSKEEIETIRKIKNDNSFIEDIEIIIRDFLILNKSKNQNAQTRRNFKKHLIALEKNVHNVIKEINNLSPENHNLFCAVATEMGFSPSEKDFHLINNPDLLSKIFYDNYKLMSVIEKIKENINTNKTLGRKYNRAGLWVCNYLHKIFVKHGLKASPYSGGWPTLCRLALSKGGINSDVMNYLRQCQNTTKKPKKRPIKKYVKK